MAAHRVLLASTSRRKRRLATSAASSSSARPRRAISTRTCSPWRRSRDRWLALGVRRRRHSSRVRRRAHISGSLLQLNTPRRSRRLDVALHASALCASHSFESAGSIHEVPVYLRAHLCSSRSWPICKELVLRRRPGLSAAALYRRRTGRFVMCWWRQTTIEEASSSTVSACFACPATAALSCGSGGRRGVATAARRFVLFLLLTPLGAPTPPQALATRSGAPGAAMQQGVPFTRRRMRRRGLACD